MVFDPDYIVDITLAIADTMQAYSPMHQPCEPLTSYSAEIRAAVKCVLKYDDIVQRGYMQ
jgi:hypothetical protein